MVAVEEKEKESEWPHSNRTIPFHSARTHDSCSIPIALRKLSNQSQDSKHICRDFFFYTNTIYS